MRLSFSDVDVFVANWTDKATNVRRVAAELNIGLDSLVFVDDSPAERELVRQTLPEVEVVALPTEPADYVRALSDSLLFESVSVTTADFDRADQYRARASAATLEASAASLGEFYTSLEMTAVVAPFDELNLSRIVQLIGKTNQFNVTAKRHSVGEVREFMADDRFLTLYLRLQDRFGDHGLVALLIAEQDDDVIELDSWLMSCRVIGRTVEDAMFHQLWQLAKQRGCRYIRGRFIPTKKNGIVRELFARLGFDAESERDGVATWIYDLTTKAAPASEYVETSVAGPLIAV
jgi:FkbH-like protein